MMDDEMVDETELIPSLHSVRGSREFVLSEHVRLLSEGGVSAVDSIHCELNVQYGASSKECVDFFYPDNNRTGAPVFVFIHGGYWVDMSRQLSRFVAHSFTKAGCITAIVGYQQAPEVQLKTIIEQTVCAIRFILTWAEDRGARGVYISGHSAGAHLLSMALSGSWDRAFGSCAKLLKGVALLSGVFDVRLIVNTENNHNLGLTRDQAWELSPLRLVNKLATECLKKQCAVICIVGGNESKTFIKMTKDFSKCLDDNSLKNECTVIENIDHFNLIEELVNSDYSLTKIILSFMGVS